jgi:hypothetical protein
MRTAYVQSGLHRPVTSCLLIAHEMRARGRARGNARVVVFVLQAMMSFLAAGVQQDRHSTCRQICTYWQSALIAFCTITFLLYQSVPPGLSEDNIEEVFFSFATKLRRVLILMALAHSARRKSCLRRVVLSSGGISGYIYRPRLKHLFASQYTSLAWAI